MSTGPKAFVLWTARSYGGFRHPRNGAKVEGFSDHARHPEAEWRQPPTATHLLQAGYRHPNGAGVVGHSDVSTTMIYTHVLKVAAGGTASPLDAMVFANG